MNEHEIYQWAVTRFGVHHQIKKAVEELGELIQALMRYSNGEPVIGNVCEEIADVEIMLEQLKIILGERYEAYLNLKKAEKIGKLARYLTMVDHLEEPNESPRTGATAQGASAGSAGLASEGCAPAGRACAEALRRDCYADD